WYLRPAGGAGRRRAAAHLRGGPGPGARSHRRGRAGHAAPGGGCRGRPGRRQGCRRDATAADLVIGVAASGRTPYVAGALAHARTVGAGTALVSCNPKAPLAELADVPVLVDTGPEVITGSTRMKA